MTRSRQGSEPSPHHTPRRGTATRDNTGHNNEASSWRSSNTVSSSSSSLFSRSESCSCETARHNSRTSELTTDSIIFAPTLPLYFLQNVYQTLYVRKHRKGVDSFGPQKVVEAEESSDDEVRFSIALERLQCLMYALIGANQENMSFPQHCKPGLHSSENFTVGKKRSQGRALVKRKEPVMYASPLCAI